MKTKRGIVRFIWLTVYYPAAGLHYIRICCRWLWRFPCLPRLLDVIVWKSLINQVSTRLADFNPESAPTKRRGFYI
jgi:hypothetical protein